MIKNKKTKERPLGRPTGFFNFIRQTKETMVRILRLAFAKSENADWFRPYDFVTIPKFDADFFKSYETLHPNEFNQKRFREEAERNDSSDYQFKKLWIGTEFPHQQLWFPSIIVESTIGDIRRADFRHFYRDLIIDKDGNELSKGQGEITHRRYGGYLYPTLNIKVYSLDTLTREDILDQAAIFIWWSTLSVIRGLGYEVLGIRATGEGADFHRGKKVFYQGLQIDLYTEWFEDVSLDVLSRLANFLIQDEKGVSKRQNWEQLYQTPGTYIPTPKVQPKPAVIVED